jgi:hypothetical protein
MPKDVAGVMHEFKHGQLHSGGTGRLVTSRKQAIAIGLSEQAQLDKQKRRGRGYTQASALRG